MINCRVTECAQGSFCVNRCVYVYVYVCVCMRVRVRVCVCGWVYVWGVCMCLCICVCMLCLCVYVSTYVCICVYPLAAATQLDHCPTLSQKTHVKNKPNKNEHKKRTKREEQTLQASFVGWWRGPCCAPILIRVIQNCHHAAKRGLDCFGHVQFEVRHASLTPFPIASHRCC